MLCNLPSHFSPISHLIQVAKIDITYAKTAKRMDVKRLKTLMWNHLVTPEGEEKVTSVFVACHVD